MSAHALCQFCHKDSTNFIHLFVHHHALQASPSIFVGTALFSTNSLVQHHALQPWARRRLKDCVEGLCGRHEPEPRAALLVVLQHPHARVLPRVGRDPGYMHVGRGRLAEAGWQRQWQRHAGRGMLAEAGRQRRRGGYFPGLKHPSFICRGSSAFTVMPC